MERSLSCTGLHVVCQWFPRGRKQRETNPVIDSPAIWKEVLGLGRDKEHEANLMEALCMGVVLVVPGDEVARDDGADCRGGVLNREQQLSVGSSAVTHRGLICRL